MELNANAIISYCTFLTVLFPFIAAVFLPKSNLPKSLSLGFHSCCKKYHLEPQKLEHG